MWCKKVLGKKPIETANPTTREKWGQFNFLLVTNYSEEKNSEEGFYCSSLFLSDLYFFFCTKNAILS